MPSVLITGAARGIGRATAAQAQLLLAQATPTRVLAGVLRAGTGVPRRP